MQSGFKLLARMTLSTGWSQTLRFHDCRLAQYGNETEFRTSISGKSLHGGNYDRHDELGDAPRYLRRLTSNADKLWTSSGFNRLSRNGDEGRTSLIKICWDPYEGRIEILPDSTKIVSQCLPGLFEESDILRSCCSFSRNSKRGNTLMNSNLKNWWEHVEWNPPFLKKSNLLYSDSGLIWLNEELTSGNVIKAAEERRRVFRC